MKLTRYPGNPILSPCQENSWESLSTTNPGAWYDPKQKKINLLYRAAGSDPEHLIHFGLATSTDGFHFTREKDQPVFSPSKDGFDSGCVEDPRIIKMGDWFYVTYACRPYPPGPYWKSNNKVNLPEDAPPEFPETLRKNRTTSALALTKDFHNWRRAGRITSPMDDDRDVILFPEKINGYFWRLHRPLGWVGSNYGPDHPSIWISKSRDLLNWSGSELLAEARFEWEESKIGANTPPIKTPYGWLFLYHALGKDSHYRIGAMLLDLNDPAVVHFRTRDWLLQPETWYEMEGLVRGVCFPCGKIVLGDTLFVYYGGADKYVALATGSYTQLLDYLLKCPVET